MMQNISDETLRDILGVTLSKNAVIDAKTQEAYTMIRQAGEEKSRSRKYGKKNTGKRIFTGIVSAAAVFFFTCILCVMNPVIAKEIPILGSIFAKVADIFTYGNIPEEETENLYTADAQTHYQMTDQDIKVTVTEEYASNQAVFIGIRVENADEFPELVAFVESGAQFLDIRTRETYSFRPDPIVTRRRIEGQFEDPHTFIGVMRIDYSELIIDYSRYDKAVEEAEARGEEYPEFSMEEWADYYDMPSSFDMTLEITQIIGTLQNPTRPEGMKSDEEIAQMTDEEMTDYMNSMPKEWNAFPSPYKHWYCEGNWIFEIPVTQSEDAGRLIELNEVNEDGIGIESIELSSVEMTVNESMPHNGQIATWIIAFDAEGREMSLTDSGNVYAVSGHDVSTIYLYICEFGQWADKAAEYENSGKQQSYQQVIEECALMKVVVDTQ